jgi:hypothetical protein
MIRRSRSGTARCCSWPPNSTSILRPVGQRRGIRRITLHTAPRSIDRYVNHAPGAWPTEILCASRVLSSPPLLSVWFWRRIRRCVLSRIGHDLDATPQTFANVAAVRALAVVTVEAVPVRTVARTSGWAAAAGRFATADVLLTVDDAIGAAVSPTQVGATSFCQSQWSPSWKPLHKGGAVLGATKLVGVPAGEALVQ